MICELSFIFTSSRSWFSPLFPAWSYYREVSSLQEEAQKKSFQQHLLKHEQAFRLQTKATEAVVKGEEILTLNYLTV